MHEAEKCGWNIHDTPTSGSLHPIQQYGPMQLGDSVKGAFHLFYMPKSITSQVEYYTACENSFIMYYVALKGALSSLGK